MLRKTTFLLLKIGIPTRFLLRQFFFGQKNGEKKNEKTNLHQREQPASTLDSPSLDQEGFTALSTPPSHVLLDSSLRKT